MGSSTTRGAANRRRTARRIVVAAGVVAVIAGGFAWQSAASGAGDGAPSDPGSGTTGVRTNQDPADVDEYWTPERMDNAEPAPMPEDN
ncbi:hypothetical protein ACFT9I_05160 [Streptomyces sp. NPDC057137]|uniref:hypothetical protein n=1 Tax=Streptomyces sp. NPDC057137 TaxID=3346030 RepID=UPI00363311DC